jgi:glycosyltransferase involved in cell wall biosynthesis
MLAIRAELLAAGHHCTIVATSKSTLIVPEPDVYHPGGALALLKLLYTLKFDVLHIHIGGEISPRLLALIFFCTARARGRCVMTLHSGGYPLSPEGKNARPNSTRGFIFRRFSRIIAVNQMMFEMFERYGVKRENIRTILPFSNELPDKSVEIPPELKDFAARHTPFLFSASLLEAEYDLPLQIEALGEVLKEFPHAGLMLAGSGSLENKLREIIKDKPYGDQIMLTGDLDHNIVLSLTRDCDIMLRTTRYDGDAISVREALFLETPVIATDNGMRPDGVYLTPVGDVNALGTGIKGIARREKPAKTPKAEDKSNIRSVIHLYSEIAGQ